MTRPGNGLRWRTISLGGENATAYLPIEITAGVGYTEQLRVLDGNPDPAPIMAEFLLGNTRARLAVGEVRSDLFTIDLPAAVTAQLYLAAGPAGSSGSSAVGGFRITLGGIVVADGPMTIYPGAEYQWVDAESIEKGTVIQVRGIERGEWSEGQQMQVGDIVVHNGHSYYALADGVLGAPNSAPGGNALGSDFTPGMAPTEGAPAPE